MNTDLTGLAGGTVVLAGVVGSTAYGLAGPQSDVDLLGVYAAPARAFHGLHPPLDRRASVVLHEPDITLHEARKYVLLALQANPTVIDLMWLPDDLYRHRTPTGDELIGIRSELLSAPRVREAYLGYASQQAQRLINKSAGDRSPARVAKHARHLLRLIHQGIELYTTGRLTVRLPDPQRYLDFGAAVAADPMIARDALMEAERKLGTSASALPEAANPEAAEAWLQSVRACYP